ncbi:MAG: hypothetical protein RMK79_13650 [Anaerolineae bacterium]|nr:hypothetical protein [Anaerolineae bacterium]
MAHFGLWIDESERKPLLTVGGVLLDWDRVPCIVKKWRTLKQTLGLQQDAEIKWNPPSNHPTRNALNKAGRSTRELGEAAVKFIASSFMTCIVCVMLDKRQDALWRKIWRKTSVRDFYCEALRFILQRVSEECTCLKSESCVVVCDTPGLGKDTFHIASIRRGAKALEKAYAEWYQQGVGSGPGKKTGSGSLERLGFHPSVLVADASYHDMLQIADVVVGTIRDWVGAVRDRRPDQWIFAQAKTLLPRFRQRHGQPDFWGDGLVIWPPQPDLWQRLKDSLV